MKDKVIKLFSSRWFRLLLLIPTAVTGVVAGFSTAMLALSSWIDVLVNTDEIMFLPALANATQWSFLVLSCWYFLKHSVFKGMRSQGAPKSGSE